MGLKSRAELMYCQLVKSTKAFHIFSTHRVKRGVSIVSVVFLCMIVPMVLYVSAHVVFFVNPLLRSRPHLCLRSPPCAQLDSEISHTLYMSGAGAYAFYMLFLIGLASYSKNEFVKLVGERQSGEEGPDAKKELIDISARVDTTFRINAVLVFLAIAGNIPLLRYQRGASNNLRSSPGRGCERQVRCLVRSHCTRVPIWG